MKPGEHRFNHTEYIDINKPFIGMLYASALYYMKGKYIVEVLAPRDRMSAHFENEETDKNIGDQWAQNLKEAARSKWPLEYADYYIEVNGIKIGEDSGSSTSYRHEPESNKKDGVQKVTISENKMSINRNKEAMDSETFKPSENGIRLPTTSLSDALDSFFQNSDFMDAIESSLALLPVVNPEDPNYEEFHKNFFEEQERKERIFFNRFRNAVRIPDYLEKETILIANLIFKGKDILPFFSKINSVKFILKSYIKFYLTRIHFMLPFGECFQTVENHCAQWGKFMDKIILESIIESRNGEGLVKNIPEGKKAVFIVYETIDNVSIQPIFCTIETLTSYNTPNYAELTKTKQIESKGKKGFNKYITFAGYVDEHADAADFELFQLNVTFECDKEYVLV